MSKAASSSRRQTLLDYGCLRGRTWWLQLTDYSGRGVACACRQRSTWPSPSARGSSNKDQPDWGAEQNTGHLLHTNSSFHTCTRTCRGFTFVSPTYACGLTWSHISAEGEHPLQPEPVVISECTTFHLCDPRISTQPDLNICIHKHTLSVIAAILYPCRVCVHARKGRRAFRQSGWES